MSNPLQLEGLQRIWDHAPHNAFPDLQWWKGNLYCALREGDAHESGRNGTIALLQRQDESSWLLIDRLPYPQRDLRDPKLSIAPDGSLHLLAGAAKRDSAGNYLRFDSVARRLTPDYQWTDWQPIGEEAWWLWRLSWQKEEGYGIAYSIPNPAHRTTPWQAALWHTSDGTNYRTISNLEVGSYPSEGTIVVSTDNTMTAVLRRGMHAEEPAFIGRSPPPYNQWIWSSLEQHVAAPDLLLDEKQRLWIAGRIFKNDTPRTFVGRIINQHLQVELLLPSAGDNSYPSLAYDKQGRLLCAYYSSHEEKAAIYLATLTS